MLAAGPHRGCSGRQHQCRSGSFGRLRPLGSLYHCITRLRLDAALHDSVPERKPGATGRPRKKGARQVTLAQRLTGPSTVWQTATVRWYGGV